MACLLDSHRCCCFYLSNHIFSFLHEQLMLSPAYIFVHAPLYVEIGWFGMKQNTVPEIRLAIKDFFNGKSDKWREINVEWAKCQFAIQQLVHSACKLICQHISGKYHISAYVNMLIKLTCQHIPGKDVKCVWTSQLKTKR